jgi:hypothetical protein
VKIQKIKFKLKAWACLVLLTTTSSIGFGQDQFSAGIEQINCENTTITFDTRCAGDLPGIRFIHVHENEKTALQAAYTILEKYGKGCFTTWKALDDRYVTFTINDTLYKFDPNRIFTVKGRRETIDSNGEYSMAADDTVKMVAEFFCRNYIDSNKLIIALHNNTDGGGLTIKSFKKGGPYATDAKKVYINKKKDQDDFFLTTDESIFNYIKNKGCNIILQDNKNANDDGSLSFYAAQKKISYLNIEAQHGHLKQQLEMLTIAEKYIKQKLQLNVGKPGHK